jgi:hypothetical protein
MRQWLAVVVLVLGLVVPVQAWGDIKVGTFLKLSKDSQTIYVLGFFAGIGLIASIEQVGREEGVATTMQKCHEKQPFSANTVLSMARDYILIKAKDPEYGIHEADVQHVMLEIMSRLCLKETPR